MTKVLEILEIVKIVISKGFEPSYMVEIVLKIPLRANKTTEGKIQRMLVRKIKPKLSERKYKFLYVFGSLLGKSYCPTKMLT